tara:strand:- start:2419 stop:3027 length:609 start_codon:yes stop_codon:yes gene_type:complete
MSRPLVERIRFIIMAYAKERYGDILVKSGRQYLEEDEILEVVNCIYSDEKFQLQQHIRATMRNIYQENYQVLAIENILFDIFSDEELAKNRVILEIQKFQEFKKKKTKIYEVDIYPDPKYGTGLKLDFEPLEVLVGNIKRNPETGFPLPAEGKVKVGDTLIKINDRTIENLPSEESMTIVKNSITENYKVIKMTFRAYTNPQ